MADFNAQLADWLGRANTRYNRIIECRPSERFAEDRAAMLALPPVLPDPAFRTTTRLARDHWVRVLASDYSVHPRVIGRRVEIRADLDEVLVTCAGEVVARHPRSLVKHRVVTDPAHDAARALLRGERPRATTSEPEVEVRDLGAYDRFFGVAS